MKKSKFLLAIAAIAIFASSCTTISRTMKEPNYRVEFNKNDFEYSDQKSAEATVTKIVGIDFQRLFKKEIGATSKDMSAGFSVYSLPIVGAAIDPNKAQYYAVYNIMKENPGYDLVLYPQFESDRFSILGIYTITKVKATCRLAKLKK